MKGPNKTIKPQKLLQSASGGYITTAKTKKSAFFGQDINFFIFKSRDFSRFPEKFPVFCVVTPPPGGNVSFKFSSRTSLQTILHPDWFKCPYFCLLPKVGSANRALRPIQAQYMSTKK